MIAFCCQTFIGSFLILIDFAQEIALRLDANLKLASVLRQI